MAITLYREGSRGDMVKRIQKVVGCYPDGIWGKLTTEAVRSWQSSQSLKADGIVGPATLAKMGLSATVQAVTPTPKQTGIQHGNIFLKKSKRKITHLVIHCTADRDGQNKTVADIRASHLERGFTDIGYHYVIYRDGSVHIGRDVDKSGAHVANHNSYTIGIVYVGGLENKPGTPYQELPPKDTRTLAQKASLMSLLMDLRKIYPSAIICGHRDFSPDKNGNGLVEPDEWIKSCPSFDAKSEYKSI